ncbi:MAG: NADH-quinone oxidoreductase subunit M, partial [Verrucomicrobia bacterium]|nr:NADH-quinone oxidoreductase subunit M [Cytophagales bacterium]
GAKFVKTAALVLTLIEFGIAVFAFSQFNPADISDFDLQLKWLPSYGIGFHIGMDGISLLLVLLTAFLVPLIVLSTFNHSYENPVSFYSLILLMQAGLIGVFVALDAFVFYFFWEVALIPIYFIAALWGGERRIEITFKFFVYTMLGSLFMLVSLVYLYFCTPGNHSSDISAMMNLPLNDTTQGVLFWGLFVAFAIKMPIFPFHTWQPDTYTESPVPATMLLSGIMLKMGIYGLIRWLLPIVPQGVQDWGLTAMILSIIGIIYGSIIAIQQNDIKRLIAYSSFAHVGLMAAGVFSLTPQGMQGAVIQMISHGINVVGLFFIIEIISSRTNSRNLEALGGITRNTPNLTVYFMILMLGSVALPLTNGFIGEFLLLNGVFETRIISAMAYGPVLSAIAGLTIIFGAVYMLRLFQKAMFGEPTNLTLNFTDLNFSEKAVLFPLAFMVFWIGLYPNTFLKISEPAVAKILQLTLQAGLGMK